ncbi:MAG: hypothetical protein M1438_09170 [Deltaproteobacteria bacterium]|nr:hypothetical protein [Deltaproteobacteria bacterium]
MNWKNPDLPRYLNLISAIILLAGLGSATLIYQQAKNEAYGALGYVEEGGVLYPVNPEDSKSYLRGLELYGGTANVLVDEFRRWFVGLWHGKSLAFIVGGTAILLSFGFFYTANYLIPRLKSDVQEGNNQEKVN